MKRFFYVSAGILLLVIAYGIGASRLSAQSGGQFAGIALTSDGTMAITANGDVYARGGSPFCYSSEPGSMRWTASNSPDCGWTNMGNVLGGAVQAEGKSWSGVKDAYRK